MLSHKATSKIKKKHLKVKKQKAKVFRASEPLLSVFMWGINHVINELNHVNIPVMLMPDDFKAFSKVKIDHHLFNKESMPSHFKFKEYCPLVFRNLRERFGVDDSEYMQSLTKSQPIFAVNMQSKGSARYFLSYDNLYLLKTLTREEVEQMHGLLKTYHPYIVEKHGKTLLPQYLGMYRLTVEGAETYVVVMRNNILSAEASDKEREKSGLPTTLKDNDLIKDEVKLLIPNETKDKFLTTMLQSDCDSLAKLSLMDYTLCVGEQEEDDQQNVNIMSEEDEPESSSGGNQCSYTKAPV